MSSQTSVNLSTIKQTLSPLSLGTLCKSLAISGLKQYPSSTPIITNSPTNVSHIVFGMVGSMNTWKYKKPYIEAWWRPHITWGYLFLDVAPTPEFQTLPSTSTPFCVNENINKLKVYPKIVRPVQVQMVRTIMETFRQGDEDVRWYVMADDETVLFVDNLVEVLAKYNHSIYYYIGSNSECVESNFDFSFEMAFGGAEYALSNPLVQALATKLDNCVERYLFVSDFTLHSCLADLGVSLTREKGLIYTMTCMSRLLSTHPQSPFLSLHHIDTINPIFPTMNCSESINHFMKAAKVDQSRLLQQTICYHRPSNWSFSMSWGYSAYIYQNILPRSSLPPLYMFNTMWPSNNPCEAPHAFFLDSIEYYTQQNQIVTTYIRRSVHGLPACSFTGNHSADAITKIQVFSPATTPMEIGGRDCCDILYTTSKNVTEVKYRPCGKDEVIA
ncbi:hypothetical protein I3842_13G156600 [Carya illinoinensis]|uniref:Uncharacterized protein n=1 Tax=Carya illinoinensis TaxID=32201 RepID=A0A922DE56_CARIL|nr:hypothetical protein I3842_13G156600 [Carya illinoinensis]